MDGLVITDHARRRMQQRGVAEHEVLAVLESGSAHVDISNNSVVYVESFARRTIAVAVVYPAAVADRVVVKRVWVA